MGQLDHGKCMIGWSGLSECIIRYNSHKIIIIDILKYKTPMCNTLLTACTYITFIQHTVEREWKSLGVDNEHSRLMARRDDKSIQTWTTATLSWSEYQSKVNPHGIMNQADRRRFERERRRWTHADKDADDKLTQQEFKVKMCRYFQHMYCIHNI